jgi:hypothetical protein
MLAQQLLAWPKQASKEARDVVLGVIKSHNAPISTRDILKLAVNAPAPPMEEPLTPWARYLKNTIPAPPYPHHPVRSLRCVFPLLVVSYQHVHHTRSYLKRTILEDLIRTRDIKKVHIKRVLSHEEIEQRLATMSKKHVKKMAASNLSQPVSTWAWQLVDKSKGSSLEDKNEEVFGAEVGVGEDWSHLNKRRGRVRKEKVSRDAEWFERLRRARNSES